MELIVDLELFATARADKHILVCTVVRAYEPHVGRSAAGNRLSHPQTHANENLFGLLSY